MAGWKIVYFDVLEEEQNVWSKTHWFSRGEEIYEYSYDEFREALRYLHEMREESHEFTYSMLEERGKIYTAFKNCGANTMINVLTYTYGRWVWFVYILFCALILGIGLYMVWLARGLIGKALYVSAWILLTVLLVVPALNTCGMWYSWWGPPFTGIDCSYRTFNMALIGLSLGTMLGLTRRGNPKETTRIYSQNRKRFWLVGDHLYDKKTNL